MSRIHMSSPDVGKLEEEYLLRAFRSGWIAPVGPDLNAFEEEMADRIGVNEAVALSSGTGALHLALLVHGLGPGDIVLTSTMTFAATSNAIRYVGAEPYFVDSDPLSGNMDPQLLENAIASLIANGERPAAIVPVDLLGKSADYTQICEIAAKHGVPVIADAAESLGATHKSVPAGAWGDTAIFSFNGNKVMTTSGGGMLVTQDAEFASRVRHLATQARQPVAHYEHEVIGYNYRLSNLLAALGRAQLRRLDDMILRRRSIRAHYRDLISAMPGVSVFGGDGDLEDNCWLTSILVDEEEAGWTTTEMREYLAEQDIESRPLWKPMHLQPVFSGYRGQINGTSQRLFETGLTLPSGSALTDADLDRVGSAMLAFRQRAGNSWA